jgi:HK97 family phage portal protein
MFVVSEQRLTGLIAPITPYYGTPTEWLQLEKGVLTTYSEIYRRQPAVRSVVDFLADHLGRMPWRVMQKTSATDEEWLFDHPLQQLLNDPNSWDSGTNFWFRWWLDKLLYDRVGTVKIQDPDSGMPMQLVRIPPVWFTPFGTDYFKPQSLRIIGNRGYGDFPIEQTIYHHGYDPVDPRVGVSPMETLRTILEEESASQTWRRRYWEGNAQPSMIVTRPLDAPDWDDPAKDRFIESLRSAANRGKPLLLEEGMQSNPNASQFNPQTSQYIESKALTRQEVLRTFNVPVGLFEQSSYSNVVQYRAMLYSETLTPKLYRAGDTLTSQLATEWWPNPRTAGIRIVPAIEEAIRGSLLDQVALLKDAIGAPFVTREEGRAFVSLPASKEDIDKLALPVNISIGGAAAPARVSETGTVPGGTGGKPDNPATAANGQNRGDTGKPEAGPNPPPKRRKSGANEPGHEFYGNQWGGGGGAQAADEMHGHGEDAQGNHIEIGTHVYFTADGSTVRPEDKQSGVGTVTAIHDSDPEQQSGPTVSIRYEDGSHEETEYYHVLAAKSGLFTDRVKGIVEPPTRPVSVTPLGGVGLQDGTVTGAGPTTAQNPGAGLDSTLTGFSIAPDQSTGQYVIYDRGGRRVAVYATLEEAQEATYSMAGGLPEQPTPQGMKNRKGADPRHAASVTIARQRFAEKTAQVIQANLERQQRSMKSRRGANQKDAPAFNRKRWDKELAQDLYKTGLPVATYFGTDAAERIGGTYDEDKTLNFLSRNAELAAGRINAATEDSLSSGLSLDDVFGSLSSRASNAATGRVTDLSNWSVTEAARQNDMVKSVKVWNVTSGNPRKSHESIDGEAVAVGEPFSNGLMWPGDSTGDVNETAGCTCLLTIERAEAS